MDAVFLQSGFEEEIVYTPSGGIAKTIDAVVNRDAVKEDSAGKQNLRSLNIEIEISTDATTGVAIVTAGEDTVALAKRVGETATTMTVGGIIYSDAGAWRLRLR